MEIEDSGNWRSLCEQVEPRSEPITFMEFVFNLLTLPDFERHREIEEEEC